MTVDHTSKFDEELQKVIDTTPRPNILLIGATGAGKSSIINHCFGKELADVGIGHPVTQTMQSYSSPNVPVVIYDSKGYEIGSEQEQEFMDDVIKFCTSTSGDVSTKIHLAWYCIPSSSARITDFDIETIKKIGQSGVPIAILLTKSDLVSEEEGLTFRSEINKIFPSIRVFEVSTLPKLNGMEFSALIDWSTVSLPEALKLGFVAAQRTNLQAKKDQASSAIKQHVAAAVAVAFSPIPFSDAPLLLANQYALAARIVYIYNLDGFDSKFSLLLKVAMSTALPTLGRMGAAELVKFIPGLGTWVGGVINAGVASTITYALGHAISETCAIVYEKNMSGNSSDINNLFNQLDSLFPEILKEQLKIWGTKK